MKHVKSANGVYTAELPWTTALDFVNYLMKRGIPTEYALVGGTGQNRYIKFNSTAEGADIMLAWIRRWEEGHEYCPFCGGIPEVYTKRMLASDELYFDYVGVRCAECHIMTDTYIDEEMAWYKWNRRVKED